MATYTYTKTIAFDSLTLESSLDSFMYKLGLCGGCLGIADKNNANLLDLSSFSIYENQTNTDFEM